MKKVYKKLTQEQKDKGIIFTSTLSEYRTEQEEDTTHEVFKGQEENSNGTNKIDLLLDDKFFNGSHWKYNIIRK